MTTFLLLKFIYRSLELSHRELPTSSKPKLTHINSLGYITSFILTYFVLVFFKLETSIHIVPKFDFPPQMMS